jgi:hypothetical protein
LFVGNLVVGLDYGEVYLDTPGSEPEFVAHVLNEALDGEGIAQSGGVLGVESPHQNNFAMRLTFEVWDSAPDDDVADWQEAFEAHLQIGEAGPTYRRRRSTIEPSRCGAGAACAMFAVG